MQPTYEFPKPLWKKVNGVVEHRYANSKSELDSLSRSARPGEDPREHGWTTQYIHQPYPRALHGPAGHTLRVENAEQEKSALAKGWMLKPAIVDADRPDAARVLTFEDAPPGLTIEMTEPSDEGDEPDGPSDDDPDEPELVGAGARKRGRPRKDAA